MLRIRRLGGARPAAGPVHPVDMSAPPHRLLLAVATTQTQIWYVEWENLSEALSSHLSPLAAYENMRVSKYVGNVGEVSRRLNIL